MNLTGRDLSLGMSGQDVRRLQLELVLLGSTIPENEKSLFGKITRDTVIKFQQNCGLDANGIVNQITSKSIESELEKRKPKLFAICGRVFSDGSPLSGVVVKAFDIDVRRTDVLGNGLVTTDQNGYYEIFYSSDQFHRVEKDTADLTVHIVDNNQRLLMASGTLYNAPTVCMMHDLLLDSSLVPKPPDYEVITNKLLLLLEELQVDGVSQPTIIDKLADLKKDDVDFLVGETGMEQQKLHSLVAAALLSKKASDHGLDLSAQVFYGLSSQGISLELDKLFHRTTTSCGAALMKSIDENLISNTISITLDTILTELERLIAILALETSQSETQPSIGQLLELSSFSAEEQITFVSLYFNHEGKIEEFWDRLHTHPDFAQGGKVENIQNLLQFALLTLNHLPLIREIQRNQEIRCARDLVKLDIVQWTNLIKKQVEGGIIGVPPEVPGSTFEERLANYVNNIIRMLQFAFPTDAVAQIVRKVPGINMHNTTREMVLQFFTNGNDFDLGSTNIDAYVAQNEARVFDGNSETERLNVINQIKCLQRVFQISTGPNALVTLLRSGIRSAHDLIQIPRTRFVAEFHERIGSEKEAHNVYDRAQHISATTLYVYSKLYQELFDVHTRVTGL
jgi:hypothetical protein